MLGKEQGLERKGKKAKSSVFLCQHKRASKCVFARMCVRV